jgi:hypothetical protein
MNRCLFQYSFTDSKNMVSHRVRAPFVLCLLPCCLRGKSSVFLAREKRRKKGGKGEGEAEGRGGRRRRREREGGEKGRESCEFIEIRRYRV